MKKPGVAQYNYLREGKNDMDCRPQSAGVETEAPVRLDGKDYLAWPWE